MKEATKCCVDIKPSHCDTESLIVCANKVFQDLLVSKDKDFTLPSGELTIDSSKQ